MPRSMTGYGRGEAISGQQRVACEMRSVNHRFSEIVVRLPRALSVLEDRVRKTVADRVVRGRVDISITVESLSQAQKSVSVDIGLAAAYHKALCQLQAELGLPGQVTMLEIIGLPQVFCVEEKSIDPEDTWLLIAPAVNSALDGLIAMREREGDVLVCDILARCKLVEEVVNGIAMRAPQVVEEYRQRLEKRLAELLPSGVFDESRLSMEVAMLAERASIEEETVRLGSHLRHVGIILSSECSSGRKLDFLLQEMNREINTIASKSQDLPIAEAVVIVKSELEKIREQIQNLE